MRIDGVNDGLMEDPRRCTIDVDSLTGLDDQQKKALATIYGEKKLPDGSVIYPAQPVGGEGDTVGGWPLWINGVNPMLMLGAEDPELALRLRHRVLQILCVQRSGVGLLEVRLRELSP